MGTSQSIDAQHIEKARHETLIAVYREAEFDSLICTIIYRIKGYRDDLEQQNQQQTSGIQVGGAVEGLCPTEVVEPTFTLDKFRLNQLSADWSQSGCAGLGKGR
ncbi:uncharacterized protein CCOS01_11229 [Colletotrichum costaricense]|uniref:Uncharacterized protein n=1 Tax=Colletotrichum costaricense TaxID=1209916 RepID=A0AAJ0DX76_9PEZI|nr:uncharacterized protein CCOS01_11229 [Colletotrichum costaricense]KAK1519578.1 hypothetical protein CCOS01_11229 [Colletotrichum costaricense]